MKTANTLEGFLRLFLILWGIVLFFGLGGSCLDTGYMRGMELIPYSNDFILRQIEFHNNNFLATLLLGVIYYIFFNSGFKVQGQNVIRLLLFYTFLASLFLTIQIFLRCHVMPTFDSTIRVIERLLGTIFYF